jgi:hypothetical protein
MAARLTVVDGDPEQTARLRGWLARHPEWTLRREGMRWLISDGHRETSYGGLAEALDELDRVDREPGGSTPGVAPAKPSMSPPDIIA